MNERIKELANKAGYNDQIYEISKEGLNKFAVLIVKDCADFVRKTYDHESAEAIAWTMEIEFGLHGDYA